MLQGPQKKPGPDDLFIELDEPHRTYEPGETLAGSVVVVVPRDTSLSLSCGLQGSIRIRSNLVKSKGTKHLLFQDRCVLWGADEQENERSNTSSPESVDEVPAITTAISRSRSGTTATLSSSANEGTLERTGTATSDHSSLATITNNSTNNNKNNSSSSASNNGTAQGSSSPSPSTNGSILSSGNDTFSSFKHFIRRPVAFRASSNGSPNGKRSESPSRSSEAKHNNENNKQNGSSDTYKLLRGEHVFAFEFVLPKKGLYNSLEFERGSISYVLTAFCHVGGRVMSCKRYISVICPIDVSHLAAPRPAVLTANVHKKKKEKGAVKVAVEIPRKGYLRGESVPVKVTVNHIKKMRSLKAIVVTLSRISVVCTEGSEAQSFRKDLFQTVSPLYTDPQTLSAVVSTTMKIPTDTFPTTVGCPMVSFQYCVEAVVDLAGRWDSTEDFDLDHNLIDSDKLKSGRGVVTLWTEIVIGSKRSQQVPSPVLLTPQIHPSSTTASTISISSSQHIPPSIINPTNLSAPSLHQTITRTSVSSSNSIATAPAASGNSVTFAPAPSTSSIPSPDYTQSGISEKERLRQMELALLPSEPPTNGTSGDIPVPEGAAPHYDDPSYDSDDIARPSAPPHPSYSSYHPHGAPGPSSSSSVGVTPTSQASPRLPSSSSHHHAEDGVILDKLEMERLRLQDMQSDPPPPSEEGTSNFEEESAPQYEPSAPSAPMSAPIQN